MKLALFIRKIGMLLFFQGLGIKNYNTQFRTSPSYAHEIIFFFIANIPSIKIHHLALQSTAN